jgi:hypothetical protein
METTYIKHPLPQDLFFLGLKNLNSLTIKISSKVWQILLPLFPLEDFLSERITEPVLLNVYGAPELIPRNEFRQPT